jgi:hypothetical protein
MLQAATAGEAFEAAIHAQKVGAALDSGVNGDVNSGVNGDVNGDSVTGGDGVNGGGGDGGRDLDTPHSSTSTSSNTSNSSNSAHAALTAAAIASATAAAGGAGADTRAGGAGQNANTLHRLSSRTSDGTESAMVAIESTGTVQGSSGWYEVRECAVQRVLHVCLTNNCYFIDD